MSDSLITWTQDHLSAIFQKTRDSPDNRLDDLFLSTFTPDAKIVSNHESISLDQFKQELNQRFFAANNASVTEWKDIVDIPDEGTQTGIVVDTPDNGALTGIVGACFIVTRALKFLVHDVPAQILDHEFVSAKVANVDSGAGTGTGAAQPDSRRISELFITSVSKPVPFSA